MKNLLTQWRTEEENQKILSVFSEKSPNLQVEYFLRGKPRGDWAEERSRTFLLAC